MTAASGANCFMLALDASRGKVLETTNAQPDHVRLFPLLQLLLLPRPGTGEQMSESRR